jgi:hypothetical protein
MPKAKRVKSDVVKVPKPPQEVKCNLCGKKVLVSDVIRYKDKNYHAECVEQKKINEAVHAEWEDLCAYVHKHIMGWSEDMKFPNKIILRLRGLHEGQFIANKRNPPNAHYSFKAIKYTFMTKRLDIIASCAGKSFKDDVFKFNYIMAIIENSINEVVLKMKNNAETNRKLDNLEISDLQTTDESYTPPSKPIEEKKPESKTVEKLKNLW